MSEKKSSKRERNSDNKEEDLKKKKKNILQESSDLYKCFISYRDHLDKRNDKYERLVKTSRDITIRSKRVIFGLLRKHEELESLVSEAEENIKPILELISKIAEELVNEDPYRFLRAVSPGLQEFIEAVSLLHYLKSKKLVSYEEVLSLYFQFENNKVLLTHYDYILGVADLTGELMRMAINCISEGNPTRVDEICLMLRLIYNEFSVFSGVHRDMNRKMNVMKNSLKKVENACYVLKIRGSEVPAFLLEDLNLLKDSDENSSM